MTIRPGTKSDIPQIIELLKLSLGEGLMPKSEKYWQWKHVDNPFGESPVLLAFEGEELVGVRAFMRWRWTNGIETIEAIRAVDTATHPDHQGKGIFKKLTLAALDHCKEMGINMVYNTPNEQSKPGYIKMGWKEVGKLPIGIRILSPIKMFINYLKNKNVTGSGYELIEKENEALVNTIDHADPGQYLGTTGYLPGIWRTDYSIDYIKWRYARVPVAKYFSIVDHGLYINYRIKENRWGRELRICDIFVSKDVKKTEINKVIKREAKNIGAVAITYGSVDHYPAKKILKSTANPSIGPIVTWRFIQDIDETEWLAFNQWSPSLGDLELF
ncbi:GNAT family N-acetyltransferase [Marinigracilibium pacificum]|uniref:GNAT family N-acetyltransferase n=1 Tax=Marinigracilibium pacificum TaxID=2729599 RepID=A0A848IXZ0_9BACT|nr:GNAT family N-acetyltransferase [Marinigracilibium pacificum]NMM48038.1 GNAT family N-acetyltransferase [Marinigracilibium pacificum]